MLGKSTFGLSMLLLKWLPIRLVDRLLLVVSRLLLGNTSRLGLDRPKLGPLELKNLSGKTPVLDVGTLAKIKSGDIEVLSFFIKSNLNLALFFFFIFLSLESMAFYISSTFSMMAPRYAFSCKTHASK